MAAAGSSASLPLTRRVSGSSSACPLPPPRVSPAATMAARNRGGPVSKFRITTPGGIAGGRGGSAQGVGGAGGKRSTCDAQPPIPPDPPAHSAAKSGPQVGNRAATDCASPSAIPACGMRRGSSGRAQSWPGLQTQRTAPSRTTRLACVTIAIHIRRPTSCDVPPAPPPSQHPSHTPARRTAYRMAAAHKLSRTAVGSRAAGQCVGRQSCSHGQSTPPAPPPPTHPTRPPLSLSEAPTRPKNRALTRGARRIRSADKSSAASRPCCWSCRQLDATMPAATHVSRGSAPSSSAAANAAADTSSGSTGRSRAAAGWRSSLAMRPPGGCRWLPAALGGCPCGVPPPAVIR